MIHWDPRPEIFTIPYLHWPVLWYGVLFALGFILGFPLFVSILTRYLLQTSHSGKSLLVVRKKAVAFTDKLTVYMVIATIVGARLGHFLFYEKPSTYLCHPVELLRVWEGGLASHGAILAIIVALILFSYRHPLLSWLHLLDFVAVPTALVGACIRIGNFFNQEILGTPTHLPWGVVFGHPIDQSFPVPRHPVQLYEAIFYLAVFVFLWSLTFRPRFLLSQGKLVGLFLMIVFGFRFLVEFLKEEQSHLLPLSFPLTMGQILSLPAILLGLIFYTRLFGFGSKDAS